MVCESLINQKFGFVRFAVEPTQFYVFVGRKPSKYFENLLNIVALEFFILLLFSVASNRNSGDLGNLALI
jgi:hypothetical protein